MKLQHFLMVIRQRVVVGILIGMTPLLSACATPQFPETGVITPYDGKWTVNLDSQDNPNCKNLTGAFEVRYGYTIGLVEWRHQNYDIWGQIDQTGRLDGLIGQLGVSGAKTDVTFANNTAAGTWESKGCGKGTLKATKIQG